jgi:hypothetical protein
MPARISAYRQQRTFAVRIIVGNPAAVLRRSRNLKLDSWGLVGVRPDGSMAGPTSRTLCCTTRSYFPPKIGPYSRKDKSSKHNNNASQHQMATFGLAPCVPDQLPVNQESCHGTR